MSSTFTPQSVHAISVSLSNVTSSNGNLGIGVTNPMQALEVAGNAIVGGSLSAGNIGMFRNRIINGDMRINQRGLTTMALTQSTLSTKAYLVDRTYLYSTNYNVTMSLSNLKVADAPFGLGFTSSISTDVTYSAVCSAFSRQDIEGFTK